MNPLLEPRDLPPFSAIRAEHAEPAIDTILAENRAAIASLLQQPEFNWDNLPAKLEELDDRLENCWSPIRHLNAVMNSDELRNAYNACLPKLTAYATELGQNEELYKALQTIRESTEYTHLNTAQRRHLDNLLRDFRLSGVALPTAEKQRFKEFSEALSKARTRFEENLLDATQGWHLLIKDESLLAGLPENSRAMMAQAASREGQKGWRVGLDFPSYHAILTHADDRTLRETLYQAYSTRASDQGPQAGEWDNGTVMEEILDLRHGLATLLGFANHAERSLATKMATSSRQVLDFLHDLAERSLPAARNELDEITAFARKHHQQDELAIWDINYYAEKLRQHKYKLSQEELRPWFPAERVIKGMFEVVQRLFDVEIRAVEGIETWHEDVLFFDILDHQNILRGRFYLDLYTRPQKRGGAWMAECRRARERSDGNRQIPVAYLTCNFTPPVGDKPALLSHDEVLTLFHEFGHGLHHMLTRISVAGVSGINGVPWDAVELPSQFLENWCWQRDALDLFARHHETGAPLPDELFARMQAARNFQAAMQMVRQLEFALFDFRLHQEYRPGTQGQIQKILDEVRSSAAVLTPPAYNRFQNSFSHIFAGGYAAGYYSYKWAEVLSSDAFARFEEEGIFNPQTGADFRTTILEQGGAREPLELFIEFRGREPVIDALLRHSGLAA